MNRLYILALTLIISMGVSAQTSYSQYDVNRDGKLSTADVTAVVDALLGKTNIVTTNIKLSKTSLELPTGKSESITATVTSSATTPTIAWSSSDNSVATVTSEGVITAKQAGTATITAIATDGTGAIATCILTVITSSEESEDIHFGGPGTLDAKQTTFEK